MSNVLVLACYDLAAVPVIKWLSGEHRVRAVLGRSAVNIRMPSDTRELLRPLADWAWVSDLFTSPETISVVDRWAEAQPFDSVVCLDEFGLITAARLRRRLGVKVGQDVESALAYRHKNVMHALVSGDVPVPEQEVVDNACDLIDAVKQIGLPAMLKPVDSAGGMGNVELRTEEDVNRVLRSRGMEFTPTIVQKFVPGQVFHVDAFIDTRRLLRAPCVSIYGTGMIKSQRDTESLDAVRRAWAFQSTSSMLDPDDPDFARLTELTQRVVSRLPSPGGAPVHAEFIKSPSEGFVFCEIGARAGGAGVVGAYRKALGPDLYELHARAQAGEESNVAQILRDAHDFHAHGWHIRPVTRGVLLSVPQTCPVPNVVEYTVFGRIGQSYDEPTSSVDSMQHFVVRGPDFAQTFAALDTWCEENNLWARQ